MRGLVATASVEIAATPETIWSALTDAAALKQFMFGSTITSTWKKGAPITWKGEWEGRPYEDKGTVLRSEPPRLLQYTHFSPLMGKPDQPENYHTLMITLEPSGQKTRVTLEQDNNDTEDARAHSRKNWEMMLASLKKFVEKK